MAEEIGEEGAARQGGSVRAHMAALPVSRHRRFFQAAPLWPSLMHWHWPPCPLATMCSIVELCCARPALLRQFEGQHLSNLLWGLCRSGFKPRPAFLRALAQVRASMGRKGRHVGGAAKGSSAHCYM